jgi:glucokinase-like ROK family protein
LYLPTNKLFPAKKMNKFKISDQAFVREFNTSVVMDHIRLYAPISRAELAVRTGLNRSTITLIINELIDRGYVHETNRRDPSVGRPGMLLQFNPNGGFAIGIEIGVDFISVLLTNFVADILWSHRETIVPGIDRIAMMEMAENIISQAFAYGKDIGLRPLGIGVGIPGLVDARQGKLVFAPNLKWSDIPIRLIWMSRFNVPVFVENEANCAAFGEYFYGVAHDTKDFIYLKTGVGLGSGIMIDGRLFKGANGFAGEAGHVTLYQGGEVCGCGRRGCWETYVSPAAIINSAVTKVETGKASIISDIVRGDLTKVTLATLVEAAELEDPVANSTFEEAGVHLGIGIANLANIFDPGLIVLGGALSLCGKWLIPTIQKILQENILPPLRDKVRVEVSARGEDACAIGAAALVLDDLLREPMSSL